MSIDQQTFRGALLDPSALVPSGLSDGQSRPAGRRFNVYRNNVAVSLREALQEGFPVLSKLIGTENMDGLAGLFLRAHPPSSPVLMRYGEELPDFIAGLPQLAHLGYLPDIARLELALRRAYHAADATPADVDRLGDIAPDSLMRAQLRLAPAVGILRSPWPIHAIWRFNSEPDAPPPLPGPQDILIARPELDPIPRLLPPGGGAFVLALAQSQTISTAHAAASSDVPDFDPGPCLALLLRDQAITAIQLKD